jgi:Flp pilus assembly protein TadD
VKSFLLAAVLGALVAPLCLAAPKNPSSSKPRPAGAAKPEAPAPDFKANLNLADVPIPASAEAQALARRGMSAFGQGDIDAAQRHFESALLLAPNNSSLLINLGLIAHRRQRFPEAEAQLLKVVRREPGAGLAWLILGIVYYDQDKLDHALAALAQAVLLEPKDARAHHYLGVTIGRKGWYSGAEDEMRKAIELQPDYSEAHFNLAVFYLQRTPPAVELARRHYQKALDLGAPPDEQVAAKLK